jgi:hypothetical protein
VHPVDPQGVHVADDPVVNPFDNFFPCLGVAPHKADPDLEILLLGSLGGSEPAANGGRICRKRLLSEDIHAFLDGVLEVKRAKSRVGGQ